MTGKSRNSHRRVVSLIATFLFAAASVFVCLSAASVAYAGGLPTATLQANPNIILADGRSTSTITVNLSNGNGEAPPDGTQVHFSTTEGTLSSDVASVTSGVARITLTSSPIPGHATITASFISPDGSASGSTVVEFTSDSSVANTDQVMSNWIRISSNEYLAYCADFHTVDAAGKNHGVKIAYRGLTISANAAQVDLDGDVVRAQVATLQRGNSKPLNVDSLYFDLDDATGQGIQADAPGTHTLQNIKIDGNDLKTTVLTDGGDLPANSYDFRDLSAGHVVISAASIGAQPHNQVQIARASLYMDGKHVVSMPNQVMPINTDQPFGQQVLGYGTSGLFLDMPYYTTLTPKATGLFSLRSDAAAIQAGTDFPGRPAYALDYDRSFSDGNHQGDFKIDGLSTENWGLRWTESQRLAGGTQAYFFVDSPEHQTIYSTANLRHDFKSVALNLNMTDNTPLNMSGLQTTNSQAMTADLSTPSHTLFGSHRHGLFYSEDANYNYSQSHTEYLNGTYNSSNTTEALGLRMFTSPIQPTNNVSITDSLGINQTYYPMLGGSTLAITGNLQLAAAPSRYSHMNMSLTYNHAPLLNAPAPIVIAGRIIGSTYQTDTESLNWSYGTSAKNGIWNLLLGSTYGLPTKDLTASSSLNYRMSSQMHFTLGSYYSQFFGYGYSDYTVTVAHRFGLRDISLSWSALLHRWQFNLADAQY